VLPRELNIYLLGEVSGCLSTCWLGVWGWWIFYAKLWRLQVGPLVTWLDESINMRWARLPVPPQLLLLIPPTQVARRVFARLFFANEGVFVFGFGFEDDEGEAFGIQEEEVYEPLWSLFEVFADAFEGDAGFEADVSRFTVLGEEAPASLFKELVDLDAGGCFLHSGPPCWVLDMVLGFVVSCLCLRCWSH
jgi:hypothetical protein